MQMRTRSECRRFKFVVYNDPFGDLVRMHAAMLRIFEDVESPPDPDHKVANKWNDKSN